jgi:cephalosporin hydroxylase
MSGVGTLMAVMGYEDRTRHEITAELRAREDLIFQFTRAWYQSPYTFRSTRVLGHLACKMPTDLWIFHDLFQQYRFETVIETGTGYGGATLWYATLMDLLGIDGRVYTIDTEHYDGRPVHPRIEYLRASSLDPLIVESLAAAARGPVLVNLDSDHLAGHVLAELELYAPLVPVGGWLVVEDTNGAPVLTDEHGARVQVEGPFAAVMEYLTRHPGEFLRDVVCERYWLTMNPHGWLQRAAVPA